jgi:hypothetical protein
MVDERVAVLLQGNNPQQCLDLRRDIDIRRAPSGPGGGSGASGGGSGQSSICAPAATLGNRPIANLVQTLSTQSREPLKDRETVSGSHSNGGSRQAIGATAIPAVHAGLPGSAFAGSSAADGTSGTPKMTSVPDPGANLMW